MAGTTVDATPSVAPAADGQQQTGGARTDVFYSFVAPCSTVTLTVSDVQSTASTVSVGIITVYSRRATTYTSVGQQAVSLALSTLTAGQTYYVRVQTCENILSSYRGLSATFNICATIPHAQFAPFVPYAGSQAGMVTGVAVQDLNGDRYPDIVTSNRPTPTAGVLLNQGNGRFGPGISYASNAREFSREVVIEDVNNDGSPDLVLAHASEDRVAVFLNRRDGTFNAGASYEVSAKSDPESVGLGDVNNDGLLDIVTANNLSKDVSILLNKGNGQFSAPVVHSTGTNSFPVKVRVADLNQDGYADILVGHNYYDYLSVFYNGPGGIAAPVTFSTGLSSWPVDLTVADMNADGHPDVVTAHAGSNSVGLLLNRRDGTLAAPVRFATATGPASVAVGDLSGDGRPDIAVGTGNNTVGVLYNLGNATFTSTLSYRTEAPFLNASSPTIALSDVDRDGKLDIVAANYESATVSILRNTSTCTSTVTSSEPELKTPEGLVVFPNPASGSTTVRWPLAASGTAATLTLRDTQGRLVLSKQASGLSCTVELHGLTPGLYFVRIQCGSHTWAGRLLVERPL
ncbi:T9SS type A sorting domain-containing protein [Hymenobacter sp. UYP22]|uniref:T9SS type A sorting domain-containing protein n=1 Tax=Hymenobacter sp. UYP22 TaxID=3156348 RepID=UPI0033949D91